MGGIACQIYVYVFILGAYLNLNPLLTISDLLLIYRNDGRDNDISRGEKSRAYERLVRRVLDLPNKPALILMQVCVCDLLTIAVYGTQCWWRRRVAC